MAILQNRAIDIINFEKYSLNSTEDIQSCDLKHNVGLKTLLQQCISEPVIYDDLIWLSAVYDHTHSLFLVYKFKRIVGKPSFYDQFKKSIKHSKME